MHYDKVRARRNPKVMSLSTYEKRMGNTHWKAKPGDRRRMLAKEITDQGSDIQAQPVRAHDVQRQGTQLLGS